MRLLDRVVQASSVLHVRTEDGDHWLPGAGVVSSEVAACPLRFVCDDAVTAAMAKVALDFPLLADCADLLRLPANRFWLEWNDQVRRKLFADQGIGRCVSASGQRVGVLVATNRDDERAGSIQSLWEEADSQEVDLSPLVIDFNFSNGTNHTAFTEAGLVQVDGDACLNSLLRMARFRMRPEWIGYYQSRNVHVDATLVENAERVALDVNMVMAFGLLLAAREPLTQRPVDWSKLNRSRLKSGKPALLNHIELSLPIEVAQRERALQAAAARAPTRLHVVRAHLVRRGHAIFWRRSHLRGHVERGTIASKTITLKTLALT